MRENINDLYFKIEDLHKKDLLAIPKGQLCFQISKSDILVIREISKRTGITQKKLIENAINLLLERISELFSEL